MTQKAIQNRQKYPSLKNSLPFYEKKQMNIPLTPNSDKKLLVSSQTEIQKINNRLGMRKRSTNKTEKNIQPLTSIESNMHIKVDPIEDTREKINRTWEHSPKITNYILEHFKYEDISMLKENILKEVGMILCQINRGEEIEELLLKRIERLVKRQRAAKKCAEKENSLMKMIEERLENLSSIQ